MEILNYVNNKDEVIGKTKRQDFTKKGLIHRSVHIYILNPKNELLLARRSPTKEISPNKLSVPGGHVSIGESYFKGMSSTDLPNP